MPFNISTIAWRQDEARDVRCNSKQVLAVAILEQTGISTHKYLQFQLQLQEKVAYLYKHLALAELSKETVFSAQRWDAGKSSMGFCSLSVTTLWTMAEIAAQIGID